jgi:glycosyltransferase involved in cell wall biosynthesis
MRILIGAETYAPHVNGASYFAQRLAGALSTRHEVHVVSPSTGYHSFRRTAANGVVEHRVRALPVPTHPGFRFCAPVDLRRVAGRILDEVRPDVVHVQSHFPLCRALVVEARARGLLIVATNHFMPENLTHYLPVGEAGRRAVHDWAWRDVARVFAEVDVVTAPTPYAAALATMAGVPGPVLPISCGIDLDRFGPAATASAPEFRLRHGLSDTPTILYVGRLDAEKHLDVVIDAFALLAVDAQLVLVGKGAERQTLEALAERRGVGGRVRFTGFVPDEELPAAYAAATVFVNAGTAELQSLVTLEAMASGRPVIGADAAALPHLVIDDETGYLFPPGDSVALSRRFLAVLGDPGLAASFGRQARAHAEQHDEARSVAAFENLYAMRSVLV